jgi:hypothetical protein
LVQFYILNKPLIIIIMTGISDFLRPEMVSTLDHESFIHFIHSLFNKISWRQKANCDTICHVSTFSHARVPFQIRHIEFDQE